MISTPRPPGFYGKVPVLGDFVSRRLPAHFVRPWDMWLQDALSISRGQLGESWLDVYLTSPIWRFALSRGTCGKDGCAGIMMPSVDKFGRYFPLSLALLVESDGALPWLFFAGADWFGKLESLALSVLEDEFDIEAFDKELQELVPAPYLPGENAVAAVDLGEKSGKGRFCLIGLDKPGQMREASVYLNACMLGKFMPAYSLWSTSGSERMKPTLLAYEGLPPPAVFTEFLAGPKPRDEGTRAVVSPDCLTRPAREVFNVDVQTRTGAGRIRWRSSARSAVGNVRKVNEDAYFDSSETGLWAVADGMGGHRGGGAASKAVVEALSALPVNHDLNSRIEQTTAALHKVNADLIEMAREYGPGDIVGSTVVILLASGNLCSVVWVGDSRLYRLRDGDLQQITHDHSLVAELSLLEGAAADEFEEGTAISSVLTRALGAEPGLAVDTLEFEAHEGDVFLLCSDGLIREVNPEEISDILSKNNCEQSSRDLIDLSLSREGRDNVTVVVVQAVAAERAW